jgi:hypothetical protein
MANFTVFKSKRLTADGLVKTGRGILHTVVLNATGTITAGVVTIYDNTAASGTILFQGTVPAGIAPQNLVFDVQAKRGIYVDFDGTIANVAVTVNYL